MDNSLLDTVIGALIGSGIAIVFLLLFTIVYNQKRIIELLEALK